MVALWAAVQVLSMSPDVVAVPSTRASVGAEQFGVMLSQVAAHEVARLAAPGVRVVSADDMVVFLGAERQRALTGCESGVECMTEIAAALNAGEIVATSLTLASSAFTGQQWAIEVKRLDGRTGARLGGALVTVCGVGPELMEAMKRAVGGAYGKPVEAQSPSACASPAASAALMGGVAVAVVGAVGIAYGVVTKVAWDAQQAPGTQATVTRSQANTAQALFTGGLITAGVGLGVVTVSAIVLAGKPAAPAVALAPLPGGAFVSLGGAF